MNQLSSQLTPISSIIVSDRQRLDLGDIDSLATSLKENGQIQPILLDDNNRLIAGGRRLAAATTLGWTHINAVTRSQLSEDQLFILELEENIQRKDMTWQERCLNIKKIHDIKVREKALDSERWGQRETGAMLNESAANINFALKIAKQLQSEMHDGKVKDDARFWKCESLAAALKLDMRDREDALKSELLRRQKEKAVIVVEEELVGLGEFDSDETSLPEVESNLIDHQKESARKRYLANPHNDPALFDSYYESRLVSKQAPKTIHLSGRFHHGSCKDYMFERESIFDHIITDIPYGIDMDMIQQNDVHGGMVGLDTVKALHDVSYNEEIFSWFFKASFFCTKPHSFLITWCDQSQWQTMYNHAIAAGWSVQRWPLIWKKTYRAKNNAIAYNFTKDFEIAMVCRKPSATICAQPQTCFIESGHDDLSNAIDHPFAKPFAIWQFLCNAVALPGQKILDPFSGRGSGPISMLRMGYDAFGCELDDAHYAALIENVKSMHYKLIDPTLQFA